MGFRGIGEGATAPTTETGEVWNRHSAIDAEAPSIHASKLAYGRWLRANPSGFQTSSDTEARFAGHGTSLKIPMFA